LVLPTAYPQSYTNPNNLLHNLLVQIFRIVAGYFTRLENNSWIGLQTIGNTLLLIIIYDVYNVNLSPTSTHAL
jgi:hypothetical protein